MDLVGSFGSNMDTNMYCFDNYCDLLTLDVAER